MKKTLIALSLALAACAAAHAGPQLGKPAPGFSASAQDGKPRTLAEQKGKVVVLEWYNKDCPFSRKHYDSKNMQGLQTRYGKKGVVWYTVVSSKPGKQGHLSAKDAQAVMKTEAMGSSAVLLDAKGDLGRLYGAKTTPHLFVIDSKGMLVYMGAIDDKPTADPKDIAGSRNHVAAALDETLAGKPVSTPVTTPYGCSVKY